MLYRRLDGGDMLFGIGAAGFLRDQPEAVGQAIMTRLQLRQGEWFADTAEGTDWAGKILGRHTESSRDIELRRRISGTQGVTTIRTYSSGLDTDTRRFTVEASVDTAYGVAKVTAPF